MANGGDGSDAVNNTWLPADNELRSLSGIEALEHYFAVFPLSGAFFWAEQNDVFSLLSPFAII